MDGDASDDGINIHLADNPTRSYKKKSQLNNSEKVQSNVNNNNNDDVSGVKKSVDQAAPVNKQVFRKTSALFTRLPEVNIPTGLTADKSDFTISNAPNMENNFSSFNLNPFLLRSLTTQHPHPITNPTNIQIKVIPYFTSSTSTSTSNSNLSKNANGNIGSGNDVIIQAQTGSGKTLAYVLPILNDLLSTDYSDRLKAGTQCLVILPTRELCQQVYQTFYNLIYPKSSSSSSSDDASFSAPTEVETTVGNSEKGSGDNRGSGGMTYRWIVPGVICGGQSKKSDKARLRKGITVLIATPGRLLDHMRSTACLKLDKLRWLVIDEADRFDEMGMKDSLIEIQKEISSNSPSECHGFRTVLCSATVDAKVREMGQIALRNPIYLDANAPSHNFANVNGQEEELEVDAVPNQVETMFVNVPAKLRLVTLAALLETVNKAKTPKSTSLESKVIVFFSNCATVDYFYYLLSARFPENLYKLHGSIDHVKRMETLAKFKHGILLTTDLSARGLDFPNVQTIIQFDIPNDTMACVHRIGRTGRCGQSGRAYIFIMPHELQWVDVNERMMKGGKMITFEQVHRELNDKVLKVRDVRVELARWQKEFEERALKAPKQAKEAFMASCKAYSTHPKEMRKILSVKHLHLGHYAKSFALKDAPSKLLSNRQKKARKSSGPGTPASGQPLKKFKFTQPSEFAAN